MSWHDYHEAVIVTLYRNLEVLEFWYKNSIVLGPLFQWTKCDIFKHITMYPEANKIQHCMHRGGPRGRCSKYFVNVRNFKDWSGKFPNFGGFRDFHRILLKVAQTGLKPGFGLDFGQFRALAPRNRGVRNGVHYKTFLRCIQTCSNTFGS